MGFLADFLRPIVKEVLYEIAKESPSIKLELNSYVDRKWIKDKKGAEGFAKVSEFLKYPLDELSFDYKLHYGSISQKISVKCKSWAELKEKIKEISDGNIQSKGKESIDGVSEPKIYIWYRFQDERHLESYHLTGFSMSSKIYYPEDFLKILHDFLPTFNDYPELLLGGE